MNSLDAADLGCEVTPCAAFLLIEAVPSHLADAESSRVGVHSVSLRVFVPIGEIHEEGLFTKSQGQGRSQRFPKRSAGLNRKEIGPVTSVVDNGSLMQSSNE